MPELIALPPTPPRARERQRERSRCYVCGQPADAICDALLCGKPICHEHRTHVTPDQDYCPQHKP